MLPAARQLNSEQARFRKAKRAAGVQPLVSYREAYPTLAHRINRYRVPDPVTAVPLR